MGRKPRVGHLGLRRRRWRVGRVAVFMVQHPDPACQQEHEISEQPIPVMHRPTRNEQPGHRAQVSGAIALHPVAKAARADDPDVDREEQHKIQYPHWDAVAHRRQDPEHVHAIRHPVGLYPILEPKAEGRIGEYVLCSEFPDAEAIIAGFNIEGEIGDEHLERCPVRKNIYHDICQQGQDRQDGPARLDPFEHPIPEQEIDLSYRRGQRSRR